ncbi:peptidoglycan-binding protein [Yimella sp. NH-Cas1]|uniref:peptidoglycan-binding protein n=1 Tax=Yimella sp. NH-Cas1 TaxID=2917726 RepID=UPI001EFA68FF|nr:peptidoglycan-binding protein [Yimella sp. NH-Cas1]MCG8655878.1 peptidoglycan-binding protein [Yimella sp. NH-Cas1]
MRVQQRTERTRNTVGRAFVVGFTAAAVFGGTGLALSAASADSGQVTCSSSTAVAERPTLRLSDEGSCVTQAQRRLQVHGAFVTDAPLDGEFGASTEAAVRAFQLESGLEIDGVIGSKTWAALAADSVPAAAQPPSGQGTAGGYDKYRCGNAGDKVLLVFDDYSPTSENFRALVDSAKDNNIGIGVAPSGNAVGDKGVDVDYARDKGMFVIDHGYEHKDMTKLSDEEIAQQISRPGIESNFVRPPYGAHDDRVEAVFAKLGKRNCMWNLDPEDWNNKSPMQAADEIIARAQPGSTVVVHLNHMGTDTSTLPAIKEGLSERGLQMCAPWTKTTPQHMPDSYCS